MKSKAKWDGEGYILDDSLESLVVALCCSEDACGEEAVWEGEVGADGNQLEDQAEKTSLSGCFSQSEEVGVVGIFFVEGWRHWRQRCVEEVGETVLE